MYIRKTVYPNWKSEWLFPSLNSVWVFHSLFDWISRPCADVAHRITVYLFGLTFGLNKFNSRLFFCPIILDMFLFILFTHILILKEEWVKRRGRYRWVGKWVAFPLKWEAISFCFNQIDSTPININFNSLLQFNQDKLSLSHGIITLFIQEINFNHK